MKLEELQRLGVGGRKEVATYRRIERIPAQRGFVNRIHDMEVRVMARADGYAMVRLPRCMPFVVSEKSLTPAKGEK